MRKTLTAIAAAATLALASVALPQHAEARGGRVAAGIIGGLAVGALIGAAAAHGPYYGPGYYYGPPRRYYHHPRRYYYRRYYRPHCWWERERYWNGWRWRRHRVRVCNY